MTAEAPQALWQDPLPPDRNTTTFSDNMRLPVHRWFRYSAGFSAGWVTSEVQRLGAERVFDPFAGSGTTLLAAQSAGAESAGTEIHPFVAEVARAKLQWTADPDLLRAKATIVLQAGRTLSPDGGAVSLLTAKCFPLPVLRSLLGLRDAIALSNEGSAVDQLLWLALVGILRKCSPVGTAQWQYVLPQKSKAKSAEPFAAFQLVIEQMAADMREQQQIQPHPPAADFHEVDVRDPLPVDDGWADLIVTSPPYANNYDYADAARLEMTFLGDVTSWGDLKPLREKLIRSSSQQMARYDGAAVLRDSEFLAPIRGELAAVYDELALVRETKGGRKAYHSMIVAYFDDMARVWHRLRHVAAPGGTVCFVVGDSAPYGVKVPVDRWLGELAAAAGFGAAQFEKVRDRNVKWKNRKHRVPLHEGRLWVEA